MLLKLAWRNIIYRPFSSGLSIVLLASSIMIIVLALLTMQQLEDKFDENANKVDLVSVGKNNSAVNTRFQLVYQQRFPQKRHVPGSLREK